MCRFHQTRKTIIKHDKKMKEKKKHTFTQSQSKYNLRKFSSPYEKHSFFFNEKSSLAKLCATILFLFINWNVFDYVDSDFCSKLKSVVVNHLQINAYQIWLNFFAFYDLELLQLFYLGRIHLMSIKFPSKSTKLFPIYKYKYIHHTYMLHNMVYMALGCNKKYLSVDFSTIRDANEIYNRK